MHILDELPYEIPPEGVSITGLPLTLMKVLGRGGQGLVYLGYRPTMDRYEVVKFPDISPDAPHAVEDFRREIHALSRLKCDSIVTIYIVDVLQTGRLIGRPYFTMEYVEGGSLRKRLTGQPLPVRQALSIAIEIADALSAAHAAGVVHRDIKPQNVLLTHDGKAKLIDFGLARLVNESKKHTAGFVRGTPKYISPEAAKAEVVGPQGDLYSLGALLFEMLTGRPPFEGSEYDLMLHHAMTPAPSLRDIGRGGPFPVELEGIMRSLLSKQIHERPQSAGELRRVLEGIRRLIPEDAHGAGEDVDAQDPTLSASAATVHRQFPIAISATQQEGGGSQRAYRTDAPTIDERAGASMRIDHTSDESLGGRSGIVAKGAEVDSEAQSETKRDRPMPIAAHEAKRRSPILLLAFVALALFAGGAFAAFFMITRKGPESVRTPAPSAAPTSAETATVPAPHTASIAAPTAPPPPETAPAAPTAATVAKQAATSKGTAPAPVKPASTATGPTATGAAAVPPAPPTTTTPTAATPTQSPIDDRF